MLEPEALALLNKTINMMEGFSFLWIVQTGLELNLWSELTDSKSLAELKRSHPNWDPVLLDHWLEQAYCLDLLTKKEECYRATKLGKAVEAYRTMGLEAMYKEFSVYWAPYFSRLPNLITASEAKQQLNVEMENELISRASLASEPFVWPFLLSRFKAHRWQRVLDIGCGEGNYLCQLLDTFPDLNGVGIETNPEVAARAAERAKEYGPRLKILCADALALDQDIGTFDVCLLNNVIYYFNQDQRRKLVAIIKKLLNNNGHVGILTALRGSDYTLRTFRTHIPQNLMSMFLASHKDFSGLPTRTEITNLLEDAGFSQIESKTLVFNASVYFFGTKSN